jgi:hypothetical protein
MSAPRVAPAWSGGSRDGRGNHRPASWPRTEHIAKTPATPMSPQFAQAARNRHLAKSARKPLNTHTPTARHLAAFYPAVRGSCSPAPPVSPLKVRYGPTDCDGAPPPSWLRIPVGRAGDQAVRVRRHRRQIFHSAIVRRAADVQTGCRLRVSRFASGSHKKERRFGPGTVGDGDDQRTVNPLATGHRRERGNEARVSAGSGRALARCSSKRTGPAL